MYLISTTPYLDNKPKNNNDNYKDIITINVKPPGPLSPFVKLINPPKLSPFSNSCNCKCIYALLSLDDPSKFMRVDDIPQLITFLIENSYNIEYDMTNIMLKNHVLNNIIFFISYITS